MKKKTLIILFLKKNIFSVICLLLSFFILVMGTVSYSKYINSNSSSSNSTVGSFAVSASVDSVSGLSFTNTDFWSSSTGDEDNKIAMNVLRILNFSVNNFKTDENGNTQVSDVKLKYNLSFSAPKVFAEKLAFQVFDNHSKSPMIPQIVIEDLLKASDSSYYTSNSTKYEETDTKDLVFEVKKETENLYIATSDDVKITIEEYEDDVNQALLFRMWDTSSLTNESNKELEVEGGQILPPLEIDFKQKVEFYRITITTGEFILPAGKEQTNNYAIKLVTTSTISDKHLGGTIVEAELNSQNGIIGYNRIKEIYGNSDKKYYLQSIKESYVENKYDNPGFAGSSETKNVDKTLITGSVNLYKDGSESKSISSQIVETINQEEVINATEANESTISWSDFSINNEPIANNYTNGVATGVIECDGIVYYIHKLEVERTGTQNITFTNTKYEITPTSNNSVKKQKVITETSTVERLDGEEEVILLNTIRETKTTFDGNYSCKVTKTTKEVTRTYTQTGFIYRAYYLDNGELKHLNSGTLLEVVIDGENILSTNKNYYLGRMNVTEESFKDENEITDSSASIIGKAEIVSYDYIQKKIERTYDYDEINIDQVKWSVHDENNDLKEVSYDKDKKLEFYENDIQKLWLAQCYSKNYPFYVDVIFEQTQ